MATTIIPTPPARREITTAGVKLERYRLLEQLAAYFDVPAAIMARNCLLRGLEEYACKVDPRYRQRLEDRP